MKTFLTNLGIWVGGITAVLALVDWLLTESQKKSIRGWGETAWIWLDDQRLGTFVNFVRRKAYQIAASSVIIAFFLATAILGVTVELASASVAIDKKIYLILGTYSLLLIVALTYVAWKIHPKFTDWVLRSSSLIGFFGRCLAIALPCLAASLLVEYLLTFVVSAKPPSGAPAIVISHELTYVVILSVIYVITAPLRFELGLVATMFILSLAWLVIVLVLMAIFAIAKFFLIRIVEYPKGPVLGLSGLLIIIGGLIKVFA